ncbi:MAG: hypothetical protein JXB48_05445 [Candidatus Latescibacteria bacterium]|nr:hypothetical protein [Candidatus Latescibacterota bacterium]
MIKISVIFNKRFWLTFIKCFALAFVALMILIQIPELSYDFSRKQPIQISKPEELNSDIISHTTFVSITGTPNFDRAFVYQRYGLNYTYFTVEPYGICLIARTYDKVTDEWKDMHRFLGKLRPFDKQPFSYRIRDIYKEKFQEDIPENAFFLGLRDVPKPSGWQIGAVIFASLMWLVMFYMFFFFGRNRNQVAVNNKL